MQTLENRWYFYSKLYNRGGTFVKFICEKLFFITQLLHACEIPLQTKIGSNVKFGHRGIGVVIHKDCVIGDNVWIMQNVTIGGKNGFVPIIGDNVFIGAGAVILGNVTIGNGARIGANAVVTKNVDCGDTVIGVPAKKIKHDV